MSEHMSPIPSRIYNAAIGGHVAGADQIIDDETGLTLDKVTGGALEEKTYVSDSDNGMGRVVLRKNLVEEVNTLVQTMINKTNTIYVIQYDFTLGEDITVPDNCMLEFNGGSISGDGIKTIDFNNAFIIGNSKIFDSIVPLQDSNFYHRINPVWFGVKDDGVTDNTASLNAMLDFARNVKADGLTFRLFANTSPTIEFKTQGKILFSQPLNIDFPCNVLGFPKFCYSGAFTDNSGAIIIDNQYRSVFEINVSSSSSAPDYSSGNKFGGIMLKLFATSHLYSNDITGFYIGLYLYGDGNNCAYLNKINLAHVNNCPYIIFVNNLNNAWPNGNEIYGCDVWVGTSGYTVPSNFSRGAFIKIIGDNSYGINSWDVHNNYMEAKCLGTYNMDLLCVEQTKNPQYFHFHDNRLEGIGGGFKLAEIEGLGITYSPSQYVERRIAFIVDDCYGISLNTNTEDTMLKYLGFKSSINTVTTFMNENINGMNINGQYAIHLTNPGFIYNASSVPVRIFKIPSGGMVMFSMARNATLSQWTRLRLCLADATSIVNRQLIQNTATDFELINMYKATDYICQTGGNTADVAGFVNKSNHDYYICIGCLGLAYLEIAGTFEKYDFEDNLFYGSSRPSIDTAYDAGQGWNFFDTTIDKPIWRKGSVWVDATGATV